MDTNPQPIALLIGLFSLVLAVVWLVFPFSVISRLGRLIKEAEKQTFEAKEQTKLLRYAAERSYERDMSHLAPPKL